MDHTYAQTRSLNVDFTSWTGRHLEVTEGDPSNSTLVYAADLKMRKPHMIFLAKGTSRLPATVSFHTFSRAIDIEINSQKIGFKPRGTFKYEAPFESAALGGKVFTWRNPKYMKPFDLECRDENDTLVAKFFPHTSLTMTKAGRLELYGLPPSGAFTDEVVVTGLALAYYIISQTMAAASG